MAAGRSPTDAGTCQHPGRESRHAGRLQILTIPGGFSYGDDIAAGKIHANELRMKLGGQLKKFVDDGKLVIGICNGFQILTVPSALPETRKRALGSHATSAT